MFKSIMTCAGLAAFGAMGLAATAQQAPQAEPAQQQQQIPPAIVGALGGLHVAVLQDAEGGVVTVQNPQGENAVVLFLEPGAAEEAMQNPAIADMSVATIPLLQMMGSWQGPVVFEASSEEISYANGLNADDADYGAPVFFVLIDGKEAQIEAGAGPITPILLSSGDAADMAAQVSAQGVEASNVEVMPIEFGAVISQLASMQQDQGYRVFTHPDTAALIQSAQSVAEGNSQQ